MALTKTVSGRFLDTFDGESLGSSWTTVTGSPTVSGGNLLIPTGGAEVVLLADALGSSVQDVTVKVTVGNAYANLYPLARAAANDSYYVAWFGVQPITHYKRSSGSWSQVGTNGPAGTGDFTTGNVLSLKATGTSTTTLVSAIGGVTEHTTADSTSPHTAGKVGLRAVNNLGTAQQISSFEAYLETTSLTITNLPTGWKASVDGGTNKTTASGGTATITGLTAGTSYTLTVYNDADVLQETQAGVYPGDSWEAPAQTPGVADATGSALAPVVVNIAPSLCRVVREGTSARLSWASDPALAHWDGHKVYRNGTLIATSTDTYAAGALYPVKACWYLASGDSVGDLYTVQAYHDGGNVGRVVGGISKAAPALTVTDPTGASVPCSWTSVGAYTYRLYKVAYAPSEYQGVQYGDFRWQRKARWVLVYEGTDTSYTDTSPLDGRSFYRVEVDYGDSTYASSAEVQVDVLRTKFVSPLERGQEARYLPNVTPSGAIGGLSYLINPYEGNSDWSEDVAGVLWAFSAMPLSFARYGQSIRDYLYARLNTVARQLKGYSGRAYENHGAAEPNNFDDGTGLYVGNTVNWHFAFAASPATLKIQPFEFHATNVIADIRFGYKVDATAYTINNFITKTASFDEINERCVVELEHTENNVTVHFTLVIQRGKCKVTGWARNNDASSHAISLIIDDRVRTGSSFVKVYSGTGFTIRSYKSFGVDGDGASTDIGVMSHYEHIATPTVVNDQTQTTLTFSAGTLAAGASSDATDLCYIRGGENQAPIDAVGQYYTPAFLDGTDECLGNPLIPARIAMAGCKWLEHNPNDTDFKNKLVAYMDSIYSYRDTVYSANINLNAHLLGYAYAVLYNVYGTADFATKRDVLVAYSETSYNQQAFKAMTLRERNTQPGDSTATVTRSVNTADPTWALGVALVGYYDKHSSQYLTVLSEVLRRVTFYSPYNAVFNDIDNPLAGAATGESSAHNIHALGEFREANGGICPVRIGRSAGSNGYDRTDGSITAYAYADDVFTMSVDKDVWFYTSSRNAPTAVADGSGALTQVFVDPGTTPMTHRTYYFDSTANILKVGLTSAENLSLTFAAETTSISLSASDVDDEGCTLEWTPVADLVQADVYRSLSSGIEGRNGLGDTLLSSITDAGTVTYHDQSATRARTYHYAVRVIDANGTTWSNEVTVNVPLLAATAGATADAPSSVGLGAGVLGATAEATADAPSGISTSNSQAYQNTSVDAAVAVGSADAPASITISFVSEVYAVCATATGSALAPSVTVLVDESKYADIASAQADALTPVWTNTATSEVSRTLTISDELRTLTITESNRTLVLDAPSRTLELDE